MTTEAQYTDDQVSLISGAWGAYTNAMYALENALGEFEMLSENSGVECDKAKEALDKAHGLIEYAYSTGDPILPLEDE